MLTDVVDGRHCGGAEMLCVGVHIAVNLERELFLAATKPVGGRLLRSQTRLMKAMDLTYP